VKASDVITQVASSRSPARHALKAGWIMFVCLFFKTRSVFLMTIKILNKNVLAHFHHTIK